MESNTNHRRYSVNGAISSAEQRGDTYAAIAICEEHGRFVRGANLALRIDDLDKANRLYERAIQKAEKFGDFNFAAEISRMKGELERAKIYEIFGNFSKYLIGCEYNEIKGNSGN